MQVLLEIDSLFIIFCQCLFCNSLHKLRNTCWQGRSVVIYGDGIMRFCVFSKFLRDMIEPLVEIFQFFILIQIEITKLFQQHGGGLVINKILKEYFLEPPPILDGVWRKVVMPCNFSTIQGTWKKYTCNIIITYLKCL